ncbi:MAG: FkbM family methyltransferase [Candidatus Taylorbacteria bacterium]
MFNIIKKKFNRLINFIYLGNKFRNTFTNEFSFLSDYIPKKPVILEAGAHSGSDTIRMHYAFPSSIIHSFEPEPHAYQKLLKKTYGYKNIYTYNFALGEKNERKRLYTSKDFLDSSSSLLLQTQISQKIHPELKLDQSIEVDVQTINSWVKNTNIKKIDFMWLDMQGNELSALKAAKDILGTVKCIYTEVLLSPIYEGAPLYDEFKEWMEKEGFVATIEKDRYPEQVNILFVRK